jgi:hypothetical protein
MIELKQWMETVDYRITEGSRYCWNCFGENAYTLDSWDGDQDGATLSITFDTRTQEVFQVEAFDYRNNRAYRMINDTYVDAHRAETVARSADEEAWEGVRFTDLESEEDWLEKARAIFLGEDYDDRISIPLDIPDSDLLKYMIMAHERDQTFNQFVEEALKNAIDEFNSNPEAFKARADRWKEKHIEPHGY